MKNLELLSRAALSFQNVNGFEEQVKLVLKDLGEHLDVSRVCIYLNETEEIINNKFEWCSKDSKSQARVLKEIEKQTLLSWSEISSESGHINIEDVDELPKEIREIVSQQGIKSPLIINKQRVGSMGLDECRYKRKWKNQELEILNTVSGIISNAYERKLIQEEIVSSENNFRNFFETTNDMLLVSDSDGKIRYSNQALIDKLGYDFLELEEMNILEGQCENNKSSNKSFCKKVESKSGHTYLLEIKTWWGKWDKQDCAYSVLKDVTKERENLELFSKIFEHNPLPMMITSKDKKQLVRVNPAFVEKTGYSSDEIVGNCIKDLKIFTKEENIKDISQRLAEGQEVKNEEITIKCKDGKILNVLYSIEKINSQGKKSYLSVMVDVTERINLTKDLESKCQKLTNIIEGTKLGTWEWDIETGYLAINEQWAKMVGYTLEELGETRSQTWHRFAHPEDLKESEKLIEEHLKGKTDYYDFEIRMKHRDGNWIWVHDRGQVTERDEKGKPLKMFGTHSEITERKEIAEALKESEKRFFLALDKAKAGLWDHDVINNRVFLSPMWKEILGYSDHEISNSLEAWEELWHPDDHKQIQKIQSDYLEGKTETYESTYRLKHKDGSWRWILSRGGVLRDDEGSVYRWIGTNTDITVEHEQALELERIFSVNLDLICVVDMEGYFLKLNQAWSDILGYPSEDLKKRSLIEFVHKDDIDITTDALSVLKKGVKVDGFTNRYISADGSYRYLEWRANPYEGLVYASARDVTERIEYENKILEISNRDALTNVYNRRYIFERTDEIIEEYKKTGRGFSVSILDIDHFKSINDNYGHQVGDDVLKAFTQLISENLRLEDILGRYGGEEFIVILNNVDEKENNAIIQRILDVVREKTFNFDGHDIEFTFSAGVSASTEIGKDEIIIDKLIELADQRMYQAKNSGRNRIVY